MNHNEIITQALNELTKSLLKLEKTTDIPQELDAVEGRRFLLRML